VNYNLNGLTATLSPGQEIHYVWVNSGQTPFETDQIHTFDFEPHQINNTLRTALGLDDVAYPYPSGSWNEYIDYVRSASGQNSNAGYRHKFGAMNLINFWLQNKPAHHQTPDLWMVSAQPITALKNSVDLFLYYMEQVDCDDRLGLAVYNSPQGEGLLESALTRDFTYVRDQTNQRQAGHYHSYTNIGAGINVAREELNARGRPAALKLIVLLTDGVANYIDGSMNHTRAKEYVMEETQLAAAAGYSRFHFARAFKATTGLAPHRFVTARRLEAAKVAILTSNASVVTRSGLKPGSTRVTLIALRSSRLAQTSSGSANAICAATPSLLAAVNAVS
jgi:AraC-like DNA-binding protein